MDGPLVKIAESSLTKKQSTSFTSNQSSLPQNSIIRSHRLDLLYTMLKKQFDWTGFNTTLCISQKKSEITYLPIIDASPTEYSTIYAMIQRSLEIQQELGIQYLTVVCNEAIYAKMQQIRWKDPNVKQNLILRLGAFHAAMSFLGTMGKDSLDQVLR